MVMATLWLICLPDRVDDRHQELDEYVPKPCRADTILYLVSNLGVQAPFLEQGATFFVPIRVLQSGLPLLPPCWQAQKRPPTTLGSTLSDLARP